MAALADYTHVLAEWVNATIMAEWPACREVFLDRLSADIPSVTALPILACQAVGGNFTEAVPVAAAWSMLRYAADLLDAVQDGDRLPACVKDPAAAIEYASGLIFSAFRAIATVQEPDIVPRLSRSFSDLAFQASQGQNLSRQYRQKDSATFEIYWQATILKSGSIFKAGLGGGALIGKANPDHYAALGQFGNALGIIRQIIDDCRDVFDDAEPNKYEVTLPLLLLAEKLGEPNALLARRLNSREAFLAELLSNHVPEMITSVLLEWQRRALEYLKILGHTSEVKPLETILQDFVTRPWLDLSNE